MKLLVLLFFSFGLTFLSLGQSKSTFFPDSIKKYLLTRDFPRALGFAEQYKSESEKNKAKTGSNLGHSLEMYALVLHESGKTKEAEPILLEALETLKNIDGPESLRTGNCLNTLGNYYSDIVANKKAEPYYLQASIVKKKKLGEYHLSLAGTYHNMGLNYAELADEPQAEFYLRKGLEIRKKFLDSVPDLTFKSLLSLGQFFEDRANYLPAESCYKELLQLRIKKLGETHPNVANSYNSLGNLYEDWGLYQQSEASFLQGIAILEKSGSGESELQSNLFSNLAILYNSIGDFRKAEKYHLMALEIRKKISGPESKSVESSLHNMGLLQMDLGNLTKAETYLNQSLSIKQKYLPEYHPLIGQTFGSLGSVYRLQKQFALSEKFQQKALETIQKSKGPDHISNSLYLNNLGNLYRQIGAYRRAVDCQNRGLEIKRKVRGDRHPTIANSFYNVGVIYKEMGDFQKADSCLKTALNFRKNNPETPKADIARTLFSIADLHYQFGKLETAEKNFLENIKMLMKEVQLNFAFLSDHEKEKFYENNIREFEEKFESFCIDRYPAKKEISGAFFNLQLATKALLQNSSAKWKHRIQNSGDSVLLKNFEEWQKTKAILAKLLQSSDSATRAGIDSVTEKTEKLEKALSRQSEAFDNLIIKASRTWQEVQKTLKPGEAAIEMVRAKKFGIEKTVTDTSDPKKTVYNVKGLTDTIYYAALIIKPESLIPELVLLKNGIEMEGKYLNFYQNAISKQIPDNQSYGKFWEKIGAKLGNSTRVYFSPDGVFHQINLNTLFNPKTKRYLLEEKDIRLVTATKDLVNPSPVEEENKMAELVGFPSFYSGGPTASVSTTERKSPQLSYGLQLETMGTLAELPGTKEEVDKIAKVLESKGWEVKNHTQENALEANIKESYKPRVLHIATHGFFQPDTTKGSNPLLRSGLMLTGAGSTLKGEKIESGEDGILTAYEAMNLNLDNTDLVVLSACETGLGEIKNGEGVYGLQRAFKVAGAKSIIMSLWKVDDEATQELMVGFYKHWLNSPLNPPKGDLKQPDGSNSSPSGRQGGAKRAAFLKAQQELKAKYPNPYYWGAFVMVGE